MMNDQDLILKRGHYINGEIQHCNAYYPLLNGEFGCAVCEHGYFGKILNWKIDFCNQYNLTTMKCSRCMDSYKLSDDKMFCEKIPSVDGCQEFALDQSGKCIICQDGFYHLSTGLCQLNTIQKCLVPSKISNTCLMCYKDYFLSSDSTQCIPKIQNCIQQNNTSPFKCVKCDNYFYPSADQLSCLEGTIPYCWDYDQTQENVCIRYLNKFSVYQKNQCVEIAKINGCVEQTDANTCTKCYEKNYFLISNKCCLYGQYFDGTICQQNLVSNCKLNTTTDENMCQQCEDNFNLFTDGSTYAKCCPYFSYYSAGQCINDFSFNLNNKYCSIFDYVSKKCISCISTYYQSSEGADCCIEESYWNTTTKTCSSITQINNCLQLDFSNLKCKKCKSLNSSNQAIQNGPYCCLTTEYHNGTQCVDIKTQFKCTEIELINGNYKCKENTCIADHYFTNGFCCESSATKIEYYNGVSCTVTTQITNCIQYNQLQKCIKCKPTFLPNTSGNICCSENSYFIGDTCYSINSLTQKCSQWNYQDYTNNICLKCENSYYFNGGQCVQENYYLDNLVPTLIDQNTTPNCIQLDSSGNCQKCHSGYYQMNPNNPNVCCPTGNLWRNNLCFDLSSFKYCYQDVDWTTSIECLIPKDFPLGGCLKINQIQSYTFSNLDICCPLGQSYNRTSLKCEPITMSNCLAKITTDSTCKVCENNYYLNDSGICTANPTGCKQVIKTTSHVCDICYSDYFLDSNNVCQPKQTTCLTLSQECIKIDNTTDCNCLKCKNSFTWGNSCQQKGSFIHNSIYYSDDRCSKYGLVLGDLKCTECFYDPSKWTDADTQITYRLLMPELSYQNIIEGQLINVTKSLDSSYNLQYLSSDNQCCPYGQKYEGNNCVQITEVLNCATFSEGECQTCIDSYKKVSDVCCLETDSLDANNKCMAGNNACSAGKYLSNGRCCLQGLYWNSSLNKCLKLFDQNCLESDSPNTCKTCANGYQLMNTFKIEAKYNTINGYEVVNFIPCVDTLFVSNKITNLQQIRENSENCIQFNTSTYNCEKCDEKSKLFTNTCCPIGTFLLKNSSIKQCVSYSEIMREGCSLFDKTTLQCLACDSGFYLTEGICCSSNSVYLSQKFQCLKYENCKIMNDELNKCLECNDGYYSPDGYNCCQLGNYYSKTDSKCMSLTNINQNYCLKVDSLNRCILCLDGMYLTQNKFCIPSFNYLNFSNNSISYIESKCKTYDANNNCLSCDDGYYLSSNTCCPSQYYVISEGICATSSKYQYCDKITNLVCETCLPGYVLTGDFCCEKSKYWSDVSGKCMLTKQYCSQISDANACLKCIPNYYLRNEICVPYTQLYDSITESFQTVTPIDCDVPQVAVVTKCQECTGIDRSWVDSLNLCKELTNFRNCQYSNQTTCSTCKPNTYKQLGQNCALYGDYLTQDGQTYTETPITYGSPEYNTCMTNNNSNILVCQICTGINSDYYLSTKTATKKCASYGTAWKDNNTLITINTDTLTDGFQYCHKATTNQSACEWCVVGYKNSSLGSKTCVTSTIWFKNDCYLNEQEKCVQCVQPIQYVTNSRCCYEGMYFDTTYIRCKILSPYVTPFTVTQNDNCERAKNNVCLKCKDGFILFDGFCCEANEILYEGKCTSISTGYPTPTNYELNYCWKIDQTNSEIPKCYLNLTAQWRTDSCLQASTFSTYYYDGYCCPENYFYKSSTKNCDLIINLGVDLKYKNCAQVDENNNCLKCKTGNYFSNNLCCPEGKYFDSANPNDCTDNPIPDCLQQVVSSQCLKCSSSLNVYNCCGNQYRDILTGLCSDVTVDNCMKMKNSTHCNVCDVGYYNYQGKCVQNGKYLDAGDNIQSVDGLGIKNCIGYDVNKLQCIQCSNNLVARFGQCCLSNQIWNPYLQMCVTYSIYGKNCKQISSSDQYCELCEDNYYLSAGFCIPYYYQLDILNSTLMRKIDEQNFICKKMYQNICLECDSNYSTVTYLKNGSNKVICCDIGFTRLASTDICDTNINVNYCQKFNDQICSECITGYFLSNGLCCPEGTFNLQNQCVTHSSQIINCILYDITNRVCTQCDSSTYLTNGQCCSEGFEFDLANKQCQQIPSKFNCLQKNDVNCNKCATVNGMYQIGMRCCIEGNYWNEDLKQCYKNKNYFCLQYNHLTSQCLTCRTGFYISNGECCEIGKIFKDGKCQNIIQNCSTYTNDAIIKCSQCMNGYFLTSNGSLCCKEFDVVFNNKCTSYKKFKFVAFYPNCSAYDPVTMFCLFCKPNYYLFKGMCIQEGNYLDSNDQITQITISLNCSQFTSNLVCQKCKDSYYLTSANTCQQIFSNCLTMSASTDLCIKCDNKTQLVMGHCCFDGYVWESNAMVYKFDVDFCLTYDPNDITKCNKCANGYYVVDFTTVKYCCQNGYYCNSSRVQVKGNIKNCQEHQNNVDTCIQCQSGYSLITHIKEIGSPSTKQDCIKIQIDNCDLSDITTGTYDSKQENILECKKCKFMYQSQVNLSYTLLEIDSHNRLKNCIFYDQYYLANSSSFQCVGCYQNYFLVTDANGIQTCNLRTATRETSNCYGNYLLDKDQCTDCIEGYYFDNVQKICVQNEDCLIFNNTCTFKNTQKYYVIASFTPSLQISFSQISTHQLYSVEELPGNYPGYIDMCSLNPFCKKSYLNGIPVNISKFLSCHICIQDDAIPFFSLILDMNTLEQKGIQRFSIKNKIESLNTIQKDNENFSNQCLKKDASDFGIQNFPFNCGIGMVLPFVQNRSSNVDVWCVVCKPGFKPTYENKFKISSCDLINNCAKYGDSFNECDECEKNYLFPISTFLDRSQCILGNNFTQNCIGLNAQGKCGLCQENYILLSSGYCEKMNFSQCDDFGYYLSGNIQVTMWEELLNRKMETGCRKCSSGFQSLLMKDSKNFCISSESMYNNNSIRIPFLVPFCQSFGKNQLGEIKCVLCRSDKILTQSSECIQIGSVHENCILALNSQSCAVCSYGFTLKDYWCERNPLNNCAQINPDNYEFCVQCLDQYYLENGQCYKGEIPFCLIYGSKNLCSKCNDGYQAITIYDRDYCLPVNIDPYCDKYDIEQLSVHNKLTCSQCKNNFYPHDLFEQKNLCNGIQVVKNCQKYQKSFNLKQSTLRCILCNDGYYLQNNECEKDLLVIQNCLQKLQNTNKCGVCKDGYFLSETGYECIQNPNGIPFCRIYLDQNTCTACRANFYLTDNKCTEIPIEKRITGCLYYLNLLTCYECSPELFLEGNSCVIPQVSHCDDYINIRSCRKCKTGFTQQENGNEQICIPKAEILKCLVVSDTVPFFCKVCESNFYPLENKCFGVPQNIQISNCLINESETKCQQCEPGFALSFDKTKCNQVLMKNTCLSIIEQEAGKCAFCNQGFDLSEFGNCEIDEREDHCWLFNEATNQCELCRSGYHMIETMECIEDN